MSESAKRWTLDELRFAAEALRAAVRDGADSDAIGEWFRPGFLADEVAPMLDAYAAQCAVASESALDRAALAKRLRAARNRLPCLVNKGDEIHAIAAELESSSPPTRPETTPALTIGDPALADLAHRMGERAADVFDGVARAWVDPGAAPATDGAGSAHTSPTHVHCWHMFGCGAGSISSDGSSTSSGQNRCCHCGAIERYEYSNGPHPPIKHGAFFDQPSITFAAARIPSPDGERATTHEMPERCEHGVRWENPCRRCNPAPAVSPSEAETATAPSTLPYKVCACRGHYHVAINAPDSDFDDDDIAFDGVANEMTLEQATEAADALNRGEPWPAPAAASPLEREAIETQVHELLNAFQLACERVVTDGDSRIAANAKHRAILRNDLRARLLRAALPAEPARTPDDDDAATRVLEVLELSRRLSAQASAWRAYAQHRDTCEKCFYVAETYAQIYHVAANLPLCETGATLRAAALATEDANG